MIEDWIDAAEARKRLGIRAQTLYAYASRGRLRVQDDPADPRKSRYHSADVEALATRNRRSRRPRDVAEGALAWGEPALASAISAVADEKLFYRGQDASELIERMTHEEVARLLRGGAPAAPSAKPDPSGGTGAIGRALRALAERAAVDPPLAGRRGAALDGEAEGVLACVGDAICGRAGEGPLHERLAQTWGAAQAGDAIRRALVALADHELNPSAFAARVAASTGASLAAAALAGLATLTGPRHGGAPAALEALMETAARIGPRAALGERLADGGPPPGFGHRLYRRADPRAATMLARLPPDPALRALADEARDFAGLFPNVDFALVALRRAYGLPAEAPIALFAAARAAGWIAHAIEQAESGAIIRPRARPTIKPGIEASLRELRRP